ncbi:MAG: shikimate dehydrogenase [Kyrpidia tusciae]|nr:shikimate dehydrogenase [Kyrpidia tusciae]MBE3552846.1 shikimate dehydrogenase [Kyrpidia tusciae]
MVQVEGRVALIGHPVGHSLSPVMHNRAFERLGLAWRYSAFDVQPKDLPDAMRGLRALGFRGWNITVPHKEAACRLVDELSDEAAEIGAVNTVLVQEGRLTGYNTDGWGYVEALHAETGLTVEGKVCVVVGAGGAARGIAHALVREGALVRVVARRPAQAERIADEFNRLGPGRIQAGVWDKLRVWLREADLCVNTTPVGMSPDTGAMPFDPGWTREGCVVSDIVYNPRETLLLKRAREMGRSTCDGVGMFVFQGAAAFRIWTGLAAPVADMRAVVEEGLDDGAVKGGSDV